MRDNLYMIDTDSGGESPQLMDIYENRIHEEFDSYLLEVGIDPSERDQVTAGIFAGAMKAIYTNIFYTDEKQLYNRHTLIDTSDVNTIERLWDIYTQLCYKYEIRPTILRFSVMTGISQDTFISWGSGEYRTSSSHSEWYKRAREECESAVVDSILQNNSVGGIFISKAKYGYRETSPEPAPLQERRSPQLSQAELMQIIDERAALDALPDPTVEGGEG